MSDSGEDRNDKFVLAEYEARVAFRKASHEATITFAVSAMRSAFLMNGGAIIGILTFLGTRHEDELADTAAALLGPASCFGWGIALAAATTGGSYLAQALFSQTDKVRSVCGIAGLICQALAILMWVASVVYFLSGARQALEALGGIGMA